jgi:protocatechuate 4,5-dioxygenase alpha chain
MALNPELDGIEALAGTYPFDLRTCNRTLRFNRFFWSMIRVEHREAFWADEEAAMALAGLTEEEKALVRRRDWLGIVQYGVNFFVLEKWARVVKTSNMEVYAIMRGESFEAFLKTRRVPEAR